MASVDTNSIPDAQIGLPHTDDKKPPRTSVPGSVGSLFLQYAAQPDVVLSQQRDSYYTETLLGESASELVETLLGSRRAAVLGPELRALASFLYFGLTNFVGKQTLGQEYCDIALVRDSGGSGGSPSAGDAAGPLSKSAFRLYTLIRVVVPYLQERMREGWHGLGTLLHPFGRGGGGSAAVTTLAATRARARARAAALAPPVAIGLSSSEARGEAILAGVFPEDAREVRPRRVVETPGTSAVVDGTTVVTDEEGVPRPDELPPTAVRPQDARRGRPRLARSAPSTFASVLTQYLRRILSWARTNRPAMSGVLEWVLRLHLVAFYFNGRYSSIAMRAVGARLMYTREQDRPGARYAILGLFLLVQAIGEAALAAAATFSTGSQAGDDANREAVEGGGDAGQEGDVAVLRVPSVSTERTPADAALFPRSRRKCALCMSPRQNVAATPCGHLFCWECIVGWCQTNPECPLCRQPATPQSIVCLYQYA